mgnify:CR=1 FL=1
MAEVVVARAVAAKAEKAALRSVELLERRDAASLDTLARASFMLDKKDEAIRTEEQAVAVAEAVEVEVEVEVEENNPLLSAAPLSIPALW